MIHLYSMEYISTVKVQAENGMAMIGDGCCFFRLSSLIQRYATRLAYKELYEFSGFI